MSKPLTGLKALDFTSLLPGPFASQYLVNMGAEVIRIESPDRPDLLKQLPPFITASKQNIGASYAALNRNKELLLLDLKQKSAIDSIYKLIEDTDILIEGFRPGVMKRLGLDFNRLISINERLIYCSITGYGQTGPLKDRAGHDINYLSLSGVSSYSGASAPEISGIQIADIAGGSLHAVIGIQSALIERTRTGKGKYVDISMSDCSLALHGIAGANSIASNESPGLATELLNGGSYYGFYRTRDNRWMSVACLEPKFHKRFCQIINKPEWIPRFTDITGFKSLRQDIQSMFQIHDFSYWVSLFSPEDVCVEPVLNLNEALNHPHFVERDMIQDGFIQMPIKYN